MGDRVVTDREDVGGLNVTDFDVGDFLCFFRDFNSFVFLELSILNTAADIFLVGIASSPFIY